MGFFDRVKNASRTPKAAPGQTTVPPGHEVATYQAGFDPGLDRTRGGLLVANLGAAGDEPDRELDDLLRQVEAALREPVQARVVKANGPISLSDLFAPSQPQVLTFPSPLNWVFPPGAADSLAADSGRLQRFLRFCHAVGARRNPEIQQAAYFMDGPAPATLALARWLRALGVEIRQPADQVPLILEVQRPEGYVLSVLTGPPYPTDGSEDAYARTVNEQKDRAEAERDDQRFRRLEGEERVHLATRLEMAGYKPAARPLYRATRLGRLILEAQQAKGGDVLQPVIEELSRRGEPLFFMQDPHSPRIRTRSFGNAGPALPVYSDIRCLQWTAVDLQMPSGSFTVAGTAAGELFNMAAKTGLGLALNTFQDRGTPVYVIFSADRVRSLAQDLPRQ